MEREVSCWDIAAARVAVKAVGVVVPVMRAMTDIAVEETAGVWAMRQAEGKVEMRSWEATS